MDIPKTWMYHSLSTGFGLLGNVITLGVLLAPVPTFIRIYRDRSTGSFKSLPYLVTLFSSSVWLYFGFIQTDAILLISINSFGCVMETIYVIMYILFAPRDAKRSTLTLFAAMNGGLFAAIFLVMHFAIAKNDRATVLGWICTFISICVYMAPLSTVVQVVRTKSVECMPLALSLCLTINAAVWSIFGLFEDTYQDVNIFFPNMIGFLLGTFQMCLYWYYSRAGRRADDVETGRELLEDGAALGGAGPAMEAVGGGVTQLVEDGGRLIELPVGGDIRKAEEESGREEKEGGIGAREVEDGGAGKVREGGVGEVGEGEGGGSQVVERGNSDREDGGGGEGEKGCIGEVAEGGGGGEGEERGTSEVREGGRDGEGEEGSRGERAEGMGGGVAEGGRGEVVEGGGNCREEGGTGEVAGGGELAKGGKGVEGEETSEVGEGGGGSEGEESGTVAEVGGGDEGEEGIGGGVAEGA
ncbi:hypothetical protein P8452_11309 [Trifolium repens]|nr:hypothetical protein P8452_11309 [Trifolium repens]